MRKVFDKKKIKLLTLTHRYGALAQKSMNQKSVECGSFFCNFSTSSFIGSVINYALINWIRLSKIYIVDILRNHVILYSTLISIRYS